jgi:EmrB/QacA subfamily drug resistance transporter
VRFCVRREAGYCPIEIEPSIIEFEQGAPPVPLAHRQILVVYSGLLLVMLLAALDSTIVATALPTIVSEVGGLTRLSWVVTAYLLAQTAVTPLYGKLGDIYGRKVVLQTAIVLFLIGSALCGLSRSMNQLIVFRALQGLGGGGLMVTTQAVVGDIVAPRDRGRYQGFFGAVFGAASIAGPLVGGYFTTHLTWRWIFYINVPLGVAALFVLAATMPARSRRVQRRIDYLGAALLAAALSSIILFADLAGTVYPWSSPIVLALIGIAPAALGLFIWVESRASEPILPLRLFRERTVWVSSVVGLIVGFSLFGSVTYLPLFLQVVKGASPTASGLEMLPLMGGSLITSILSGQLISRSGRYKIFPVLGTAATAAGLFLLSRMTVDSGLLSISASVLLLGLGLGMVMQVLVIAVQNAVDYKDLGVATSGATLFRSVGGALGTAVLGAIFASRLEAILGSGAGGDAGAAVSVELLSQLSMAERMFYAQAFTASINTVFLVAALIALGGFLLTWLLPERPLREGIAAATQEDIGGDVAQAFAMPAETDPMVQVSRALSALAQRDERRRYIQRIIDRAGLDLTPGAAWLLSRLEKEPDLDFAQLARARRVEPELVQKAFEELKAHGLVVIGKDGAKRELTQVGCRVFNRLVAARREHLAEIWPGWTAEQREQVADLIRNLTREPVEEKPPALSVESKSNVPPNGRDKR